MSNQQQPPPGSLACSHRTVSDADGVRELHGAMFTLYQNG